MAEAKQTAEGEQDPLLPIREATARLATFKPEDVVTKLQHMGIDSLAFVSRMNELMEAAKAMALLAHQAWGRTMINDALKLVHEVDSLLAAATSACDPAKGKEATMHAWSQFYQNNLESIYRLNQSDVGLLHRVRILSACMISRSRDEIDLDALLRASREKARNIELMHDENQELLAKLERLPGQFVAETFAQQFELSAKWNNWLAVAFLLGALVVAGLACWFAVGFKFAKETIDAMSGVSLGNHAWVPLVVSRIFVLSMLSTVVVVLLRSYRASRHIAVLNRHRTNVLRTYQGLVGVAKETDTRDMLLRAAADCIFQAGTTGYLEADGRPDDQLISLLREALMKRSGNAVSG